jgi:hypothetical protein
VAPTRPSVNSKHMHADRLVAYDIRTDRWLRGCVASSTMLSSKHIEDKVFGACLINSMSEDLKG